MTDIATDTTARKAWMGVLAKAAEGAISSHLDAVGTRPAFTWLRPPEIGSVMVRGRTGGTGAAFNLGEMTVTRCTLKLASGEVGHAYIQGRRKACAEAAALVDALMQTARANSIETQVIAPLKAAHTAKRKQRAEKAAATKVDFFTLVRGDA